MPREDSAPELSIYGPERVRRTLNESWAATRARLPREDRPSGIMDWPGDGNAIRRRAVDRLCAKDGGLVVLLGPRGTGKTTLAIEIGAIWAGANPRPAFLPMHSDSEQYEYRYWVLADALAETKNRLGNSREDSATPPPFERMRRCGLLILDEIQERYDSNMEAIEITRLLDYRYRQCLSTILLANADPAGLKAMLPASVQSRLQETGLILPCTWPSFRAAKADKS